MGRELAGYSCGSSCGLGPRLPPYRTTFPIILAFTKTRCVGGALGRILLHCNTFSFILPIFVRWQGYGTGLYALMPGLSRSLHPPELRTLWYVPAVLHFKTEALIQADVFFIGGF
jgi:hypothetical protein